MSKLFELSEDELRAIENSPLAMVVYQYYRNKLNPIAFSAGIKTLFNMNEVEIYNSTNDNMQSIISNEDRDRINDLIANNLESLPSPIIHTFKVNIHENDMTLTAVIYRHIEDDTTLYYAIYSPCEIKPSINKISTHSTEMTKYSDCKDLFAKCGMITWRYLLKDNKYDLDQSIYKLDSYDNSQTIFNAIKAHEIEIPKQMLNLSTFKMTERYCLQNAKGTNLKFEVVYSTLLDELKTPYSIVAVARNITDAVEKEKAYIRQLEDANKAKSEYLKRLSHDMEIPLNTIHRLSKMGLGESDDATLSDYFANINDSSSYLLTFINDSINARKLERDIITLQPEVFRARNIFLQALSIVQPKAKEKNITIKTSLQANNKRLYVYTDVQKIKQIGINLLNNAIKYTERWGEIQLSINAAEKSDKLYITCIISDNGVGMSRQFQKHMYEEYTQEKNRMSDREESGVGLGLALVKKTLDAMGGSITCKSELDVGTTFTVNFVCDFATQSQIERYSKRIRPESFKQFKRKSILILEANQSTALLIQNLLSAVGLKSDVVNNGLQGIARARKKQYDIYILDMVLPLMDGNAVAREIRYQDQFTPIIALSSSTKEDDINRALYSGINSIIAKPIEKQKFWETLYNFLDIHDNE